MEYGVIFSRTQLGHLFSSHCTMCIPSNQLSPFVAIHLHREFWNALWLRSTLPWLWGCRALPFTKWTQGKCLLIASTHGPRNWKNNYRWKKVVVQKHYQNSLHNKNRINVDVWRRVFVPGEEGFTTCVSIRSWVFFDAGEVDVWRRVFVPGEEGFTTDLSVWRCVFLGGGEALLVRPLPPLFFFFLVETPSFLSSIIK